MMFAGAIRFFVRRRVGLWASLAWAWGFARVVGTLCFAADQRAAETGAAGGDSEAMRGFAEANAMLDSGDPSGAAARYQALLGRFEQSSALHFNLGMAHFRQGQMGRALGHWRIAERLDPRRNDVRVALGLAKEKLGRDSRGSFWVAWDRVFGFLTLNEWTALVLALIWIWTAWRVSIALAPRFAAHTLGYARVVGILALSFAAILGGTFYSRVLRPPAVVVVKEESARTGPLPEARVLDRLREGEEVRVIGRREGWIQIQLAATGRRAWVPKLSLLEIPPI